MICYPRIMRGLPSAVLGLEAGTEKGNVKNRRPYDV